MRAFALALVLARSTGNGEWWTTTRCDARTAEQGGDWLNYYGHYAWPSRLAVSL